MSTLLQSFTGILDRLIFDRVYDSWILFGGVQARGKRTFGIYMPYDVVDEEDARSDDIEDACASRKNKTSGALVCYLP